VVVDVEELFAMELRHEERVLELERSDLDRPAEAAVDKLRVEPLELGPERAGEVLDCERRRRVDLVKHPGARQTVDRRTHGCCSPCVRYFVASTARNARSILGWAK